VSVVRPGEFQDTARYAIRTRLGAGGFGVVYEAFDRERRARVALKALYRVDPAAIYRFKREFRALADVVHPNLVALYELASAGEQWFFTMELVQGVSFLEHVRAGAALVETDTVEVGAPAASALAWVDAGRLRSALRQLALGVAALHEAGKLHRDLKPSNVLVTREGRVVILDFGLVTELDPPGLQSSTEPAVVGTVPYMAPEQAAALPLTEASDWYSVGAILYQVLTGRVPFQGAPVEVLLEKQRRDPPPPRDLVPGCPKDLDALCADLLRRRPEDRPAGREVLARLGCAPERAEGGGPVGPATPAGPIRALAGPAALVGRGRELAQLREAFEEARNGETVAVYVHGGSGMGKSALARRFVDELVDGDEAVVLAGRCYERESVPYKALDSLVDALSHYLLRLPRHETEALLPREVQALARLFPVLRRVEAVAEAPRRGFQAPDLQERRRRAFVALRELLARIADRRPLVLNIDDLHWGDADSAALLAELLRPPDPPPLLLLACYRTEDSTTSPLLRALLRPRPAEPDPAVRVREIVLGPLSRDDARSLGRALLERQRLAGAAPAGEEGAPDAGDLAEAIARESGGNPFFVGELVRFVSEGAGLGAGTGAGAGAGDAPGGRREIALDEVIAARIARLPEEARRLLEVVAVAGRPLAQEIAIRAAQLDGDAAALAVLRAGRLVRTRGARDDDPIETYHDRVREAVVAGLPPATLRERHRRLAVALETSGSADDETLAVHFREAGEIEQAGEHAAAAAARAAEALAFDRAARLYRIALDLLPEDEAARRSLRVRLGDALANAGRGGEAAEAYLGAVPRPNATTTALGVSAADALELQRRAAEQLLRSGHVDEGLSAVESVLRAVGLKLAPTPRRALISVVLRRAFVRLRGLGFRERDSSQVPAEELTRIDICWSIAAGLGVIDTIRGADFQKRHLLLALRAGEPYRVARALAMEVAYSAVAGGASRRRTAEILERARALAERVGHPHALGLSTLVAGVAAYLEGRFREALTLCDRAEQVLRDRCTGVAWELGSARLFALWALLYQGEVAELLRRVPSVVSEAEERGDLYAATSLRAGLVSYTRLAADDPDGARREADEAIERWSHRGYHVQHSYHFVAVTQIDLYAGRPEAAWRRVTEEWPASRDALLFKVQHTRLINLHLRARCALGLAAARAGPEREALVRAALRDAGRIESERMPWADGLARLVRAGVAALAGDPAAAAAALESAAAALDACEMALYAAAARRRLGELRGGDDGRALVAAADAWLSAQRIGAPARLAAAAVPGIVPA